MTLRQLSVLAVCLLAAATAAAAAAAPTAATAAKQAAATKPVPVQHSTSDIAAPQQGASTNPDATDPSSSTGREGTPRALMAAGSTSQSWKGYPRGETSPKANPTHGGGGAYRSSTRYNSRYTSNSYYRQNYHDRTQCECPYCPELRCPECPRLQCPYCPGLKCPDCVIKCPDCEVPECPDDCEVPKCPDEGCPCDDCECPKDCPCDQVPLTWEEDTKTLEDLEQWDTGKHALFCNSDADKLAELVSCYCEITSIPKSTVLVKSWAPVPSDDSASAAASKILNDGCQCEFVNVGTETAEGTEVKVYAACHQVDPAQIEGARQARTQLRSASPGNSSRNSSQSSSRNGSVHTG